MIKKIICIIFAIVICLSVASCDNTTETDTDCTALQSQLQEQKDLVASLQTQLQVNADKIVDLESKLSKNEEDISDYKEAISSLSTEKAELEKAIEDAENKIESITKSFEYYAKYGISDSEEDINAFVESQKVVPNKLPVYNDGDIRLIDGYGAPYFRVTHRKIWLVGHRSVADALSEVRNVDVSGLITPEGKYLHNEFLETYYYPHLGERVYFDTDPEEMILITMIKYYRITREEMEQIVEIMSDPTWNNQNSRENFSFDYEEYELPNVDILYTFDEDIINEYYRRA